MIKSFALLLFCFIFTTALSAQNLVLNPSFEDLKNSPSKGFANHRDFNENLMHWTSPSRGTPDYHNNNPDIKPKALRSSAVDAYRSLDNRTRTGNKMVGIHSFGYASSSYCDKMTKGQIREYIQGTLSSPMIPGKSYFVRFWVRNGAHVRAVNNLGVLFLTTPLHKDDCYQIDREPHFNEKQVIDPAPNSWAPVSGKVTATDTFRYFIIGNFFSNEETTVKNGGDPTSKSYIFIDDVYIAEVLSKEQIAALKAKKAKSKSSIAAAATTQSTIIFDKVYFPTDSWKLKPTSHLQLDELAQWMKANPNSRILIKGHTDKRGDEAYNQQLSTQRAQSVAQYLYQQQIAEERIAAKGYGASQPLNTGNDSAALQRNRRVEFEIVSR